MMLRTNSTKNRPILEDITDNVTVTRIKETASNVGSWAGENKTPLIGGLAAAAIGVTGYLMYRYMSDRS